MKVYALTGSLTRATGTTQYAAGDVMANGTPATVSFTPVSDYPNVGGLIQSASIVSSANKATKLDAELWLFASDITDLDADNVAWTPTDAQLQSLIGIIAFPTASWKAGDATADAAGNAACVVVNLGIAVPQSTIYGVLIARNTYTPIDSEVFSFKLNVIRKY